MLALIWPLAGLLLVASPLILRTLEPSVFDARSLAIVLGAFALALLAPFFGLGDMATVSQVLLAQTVLFAAFVSVSRMRQRKSAFLHALASVASNGSWFLVMFVLAGAYVHAEQTLHGGALTREFAGLLVASVAGILAGRLVGVQWMQFVERRFSVRTDSVGSPTLAWLDARTVPALMGVLVAMVAAYYDYHFAPWRDVLIVTTLGFLQNGVYAMNTRLANRDHPGWPVVTGLLGGAIFVVHWTYLIGYSETGGLMPLTLLIPYTVATVAGSNVGAMVSMLHENLLGIKADTHRTNSALYASVAWHRWLLVGVASLCVIYLSWSTEILLFFGLAAHAISVPFAELGRPLALLFGAAMFFANNITHTLSSRAGNRNHAGYHAITCLIHGATTFFMGAFVILNAQFLDLIPVAALGSATGQLFAQRVSLWMEKRLESVMDAV